MEDTKSRPRSGSPPRRSPSDSERHRNRSRSPRRNRSDSRGDRGRSRSRSRSRSPRRRDGASDKKMDFHKAFKFKSKDKKQGAGERAGDDRAYRQRDDNYRPRRYGGRDDRDRRNDRDRDRDRRDTADSRVADKFDNGSTNSSLKDKFGESNQKDKDKPKPAPAAAAAGPVTYILVTVNDRLGTKTTIPCMPSDTVGDFKKMVAAHIGRQPHEIMLKRQGERPFKDFITLGDYGVSSGVQLDLELDTGD